MSWILNGTTIVSGSPTKFEGWCTAVQSGRRVDVTGTMQANGRVLATEVDVDY